MYLSQCPLCDHVNPTGSRFCNACGAPLHLAPCPDCGTINDVGQAACRDCGRSLTPARSDPRAAARPQPAPSPSKRAGTHLLGIALGAALAVVAVYGLWLHATLGEPRALSSLDAAPIAARPAPPRNPPELRPASVPSVEPAASEPAPAPPPAPSPARDTGGCAPAVAALGLCGGGTRRE
jgi:hypothetical protein